MPCHPRFSQKRSATDRTRSLCAPYTIVLHSMPYYAFDRHYEDIIKAIDFANTRVCLSFEVSLSTERKRDV